MTPQIYGIAALSISIIALLTAIFKRQINKALSATSSVDSSAKAAHSAHL
jgi:hypothetical protein